MKRPETREEFERRFHLLHVKIKEGKMHFPKGAHAIESILNVRFLPNGRIDFLSVDEFARLQANMLAQMDLEGPLTPPVDQAEQGSNTPAST